MPVPQFQCYPRQPFIDTAQLIPDNFRIFVHDEKLGRLFLSSGKCLNY